MYDMSVTLEVSQDPMGWLNAEAKENINDMSVTWEVFQAPMGWLNAEGNKSKTLNEHASHGSDLGSIPRSDGLVKGRGTEEHIRHVGDLGSPPWTNRID